MPSLFQTCFAQLSLLNLAIYYLVNFPTPPYIKQSWEKKEKKMQLRNKQEQSTKDHNTP